jgi:hypothetical protein
MKEWGLAPPPCQLLEFLAAGSETVYDLGVATRFPMLSVSGLKQMIRVSAKNVATRRRGYPRIFLNTYITDLMAHATKICRVVGHSSTQLVDRVYGHLVGGALADSVLAVLRR